MTQISLTIDGREVAVEAGTSLLDAARRAGREIPTLCHDPKLQPVGACRMCIVEVDGERDGERFVTASCVREAEAGMVVHTQSDNLAKQRRGLTELMLGEQPASSAREETTGDDALLALARDQAVATRRASRAKRPRDDSSAVIAVDHQACVLCDRCIRACNEIQHNHVLGRTGKGYETRIGFDLDQPMGDSSCVSCGECVATCPTGALVDKGIDKLAATSPATERAIVDSICPYCGVGCTIRYHTDPRANRIRFAEGRESPASRGRLCVKGRYGYDYATHPERLTTPLIRVDYPKRALSTEVRSSERRQRKPGGVVDPTEVMPAFREASWDEALDLVARRLLEIREQSGSHALAGLGSAKCSNEEAYLFQKLVRAVFGTNNVDHCTRLCHASSVTALLQMIGSGAVTTTFCDIENADFAIVTGSNTTANHPVAATFFKQATARGTKLLVVNPNRVAIADHAWRFCQIHPGTDVAFFNAMMNVVIEHDLVDRDYIEQHTEGFAAVAETVRTYTPEFVSGICGVDAETIREVALEYGRARAAITFWGMGMSQHVHGTDNCRSVISLCLMTGNIGRPGTGLHPLRGQNNVQGASDAGLIPMSYPDYQPAGSAQARARFEEAWGTPLSAEPGLTTTEIIDAAVEGDVSGMYILGENPFLSDPNINKVRKGLGNLDFLVVQDIFLTETAEFADVILPATSALEKSGTFTNTDRRVQLVHPVLAAPGQARPDWRIIGEISQRMGYPMEYGSPAEIFDEWVGVGRAYRGLTHRNLGENGKLYPCPDPETSEGTVVMFADGFPTEDGRARFVPAEHSGADELPTRDYPLILVTGRILQHWHTGVMTRRSAALHAIEPDAFASVHPSDAAARGIGPGDWVEVRSRRGRVRLEARLETSIQPGSIFIPFHFREAAANVLTNDTLDPDAKIPELKFCAVDIELARDA